MYETLELHDAYDIKEYDCTYMDPKGNRRTWVALGTDPAHVISQFNEMVGKGRIVSIQIADEWE